jgi:ferric iron reductase protein FhuF
MLGGKYRSQFSARGLDFQERGRLYRLLPPALIAMADHIEKIGGIPTEISAKFRKN